MRIRHYLWQLVIGFDQLINAALGGWADETFSARCWRRRGRCFWNILRCLLDLAFRPFDGPNHCRQAYENELARRHSPRAYRTGERELS